MQMCMCDMVHSTVINKNLSLKFVRCKIIQFTAWRAIYQRMLLEPKRQNMQRQTDRRILPVLAATISNVPKQDAAPEEWPFTC